MTRYRASDSMTTLPSGFSSPNSSSFTRLPSTTTLALPSTSSCDKKDPVSTNRFLTRSNSLVVPMMEVSRLLFWILDLARAENDRDRVGQKPGAPTERQRVVIGQLPHGPRGRRVEPAAGARLAGSDNQAGSCPCPVSSLVM